MPATACVPSTTSTLRDGLSTGPRRHPRVPLDTRHSARSQEGKDRRPRTRRHRKVPLVDAALCPGPRRRQETRGGSGPHAGKAVAACKGNANEAGNVPTPRSIPPHGGRAPGLTPHGDRAHATKASDHQTKRNSAAHAPNAANGPLPAGFVGNIRQPQGQGGQGACRCRPSMNH